MEPDRLDEVMSELEDFLESEEREQREAEEDDDLGAGPQEGPGERIQEVERREADEGQGPAAPPRANGQRGGASRAESEPAPAPAERTGGAEPLGEEVELRRGLEVLEELIELRPGDLALRGRRLRYLRRLGEETLRTEHERELAADLAAQGHRRAARLLCRLILDRHPGDAEAEDLLSSLRRIDGLEFEEDEELRRADWSSAEGEDPAGRLRAAVRRELAVHAEALPWLYRAARKSEVAGGTAPAESYRHYARYLRVRNRTDEACDVLRFALEAGGLEAEGRRGWLEVRTDLAECLLERGRHEEAREHLEVLAEHDEAFGVVWSALE